MIFNSGGVEVMQVKRLHRWTVSYSEARQLQNSLADKVKQCSIDGPVELVAGLDCSFSKSTGKVFAGAVVLRLADFTVIENKTCVSRLHFPYIPGLLTFREAPAVLGAVRKLRSSPDVFIADGQGIAHPRRLGLASHLGLFFDRPTIGCAKSRLTGSYSEPGRQKGRYSWLRDESFGREVIGAVVRTRDNVRPLFVSVGNKCTLPEAIELTLALTGRFRLPEPARLAHRLVSEFKKQYAQTGSPDES